RRRHFHASRRSSVSAREPPRLVPGGGQLRCDNRCPEWAQHREVLSQGDSPGILAFPVGCCPLGVCFLSRGCLLADLDCSSDSQSQSPQERRETGAGVFSPQSSKMSRSPVMKRDWRSRVVAQCSRKTWSSRKTARGWARR